MGIAYAAPSSSRTVSSHPSWLPPSPPSGGSGWGSSSCRSAGTCGTGCGRGFYASLAGGVFPRESEPCKRHCGSALRSGRVCVPWCCLHRLGHWRTSLSPRPCHSHDHWVEKLPHPTRKYVVVAVAMEATERTVKICVPFFCKAPWEKLLHLLGRTQGGRASNLPSVNMARSCLSLPEFLKQSGIRYVCSSTAGKGVKAPQGGQPHTSPTMQGGGTGPQAKVQHLSQNGYTSLSLSRCLSLAMCTNAQNRRHSFHPAAGTLTCTKLPKKHQLVQEL